MDKQTIIDELKNLLGIIQEQTEALNKDAIPPSEITLLIENVKKFHNCLLTLSKTEDQSPFAKLVSGGGRGISSLTIADKLKSEEKSLHEELSKVQGQTLADKIENKKITDLKESIDINSRFLFIKELFNGSFVEYNKVIEKINNFSTKDEALNFIKEEVKTLYKWAEKSDVVTSFMKIIERKFGKKD